MRLTNHNLNRKTAAGVAIRKALKEEKDFPADGKKDQGENTLNGESGAVIVPPCLGSTPCDLNYAFKDIARRFLK